MHICRANKYYLTILLIVGGLIFCPPIFAQNYIDLTEGICSQRFLTSAQQTAYTYYRELGIPEPLADLIDSSFVHEDYIEAVIYIYLAHYDAGLEETYRADLARVLARAGCFKLSDSLFQIHLENNLKDNEAWGDYALFLARWGEHEKAQDILRERVKNSKRKQRAVLLEDLGTVLVMDYLETGRKKTLKEAFAAFREGRFGTDKARSSQDYARLELKVEPSPVVEEGKYNFTLQANQQAGSETIIIGISGLIAFGREMEGGLYSGSIQFIRDLFGTIYLAPGDTLRSEPGGFEMIGDLGGFAPFYEGEASFSLVTLFPNGERRVFRSNMDVPISAVQPLKTIYDALAYGETVWAESLLYIMADSGKSLPPRWRASLELSRIMEDSTRWQDGLRIVDSLMEIELDPNLWVFKGALYYLLGQPDRAVHPLEQAIEADPVNFWAIYNMALVQYDLGNKEHAAELFLKTSQINKRMFVANLLAGVIFEELGRYDLALEQYNIALYNVSFRVIEVDQWVRELEEKVEKE